MTVQLELTEIKRAWLDQSLEKFTDDNHEGLWLLRELGEFTSDDIHVCLPQPPDHPNWYGVLVAKMKNAGLIKCVGYRPSTRKERNGGVVRVWRVN